MKRWGIIKLVVVFCASFGLFLLGACGGGGGGGDGPQVSAAPIDLQVHTTTLDSVTISWTDNATNETGFYVERGPSASGPFATVATLGQDEQVYTQSSLSSGTQYYYRICSYNAEGSSEYAGAVLATTLGPAAPTGLQVDSTTIESVTLSWTDNATNETGFYVEEAPTSVGPFTTVATLGQDVETYTQLTLDDGRYYHYRVCAYNTDGDSPYDDVVLAMTQLIPNEDGGYPIPAVADSLKYVELYTNDSNGYWTSSIEFQSMDEDEWGEWVWVVGYFIPTRDPYPAIDYVECYYDPGDDGEWSTGDDPVSTRNVYIYDSAGNRIQMDRYNDPGSDETWGTGDDLMYGYGLYSYDSSNRLIRYMHFSDAGSDENWFTSDDGVYRTRRRSYDADGKVIMIIESRHPGIDGDWFTPDDIVYEYKIPEYDSNGIAGRNIVYGKGSDGIWFTGDDEVTRSIIYIHDSNGYLLGNYVYRGPGTDGVWFE